MPPAVIGVAGSSARRRGLIDRAALPVFTAISLALILRYLPFMADASAPQRVFAYVFGVAIALAINYKWIRELWTDYRGSKTWLQGAKGERLAGSELDKLPEGYAVFHDFHPLGKDDQPTARNVDHIVIGPTGVFIVETKNYSASRVRPAAIDTRTRANVEQVQRVAAEFKRSLITWSGGALADLFVVPLLVYTQPGAYVEQTQERQVKVIPLKWLASDITSWRGRSLDPDQVYRITRVLYSQLEASMKNDYEHSLRAIGERSKAFKLERAASRVRQTVPEKATPPASCPECGGSLVRRTARHGSHKGEPFLGCENFAGSGCRFVLGLAE